MAGKRTCGLLLVIWIGVSLAACRSRVTQPSVTPETTSAGGVQATPAVTDATVVEPSDTRVDAIRKFAGEPDLAVEAKAEQSAPFGGQSETYEATLPSGDTARFTLDAATGEMIGFHRLGQSPESADIALEQAAAAAQAFAAEYHVGFETAGLELRRAQLTDQGSGTSKYYDFWWIQVDPVSGALLPHEVRVRVNAQTGQVDGYFSLRVDVTVTTVPEVGRPQAKQLALKAVGDLLGAAVADATLAVSTVPVNELRGTQALLWQVIVVGEVEDAGYQPGAFVYLDAASGDVVYVGAFQ